MKLVQNKLNYNSHSASKGLTPEATHRPTMIFNFNAGGNVDERQAEAVGCKRLFGGRSWQAGTDKPDQLALLAGTQPGTNSSVVSARAGSANPSTHFREAFVLYFSPNATVTASRMRALRASLARTGISSSPT